MRNYVIFSFTWFVTLLFTGCSDFLDKPPYGLQTSDNFYKKPSDLVKVLTDTYNTLGVFGYEVDYFSFGNIMTDDSDKGGADINDGAATYDLMLFKAVSSNDMCLGRWNRCYQAIYKCNLIIDKAPLLEKDDPDLIKRVVAEAYFLRGMYYYTLATTFGGVPLVTISLNMNELNLSRSGVDDTWDLVEQDFSEAAKNLPLKSEYGVSDLGRATSGVANAMLAKTYLMRQKYKEAEEVLATVVNSGEYKLVEDYGKIFTKEFENSVESVFEVQHSATKSGWEDTEGTVIPVHCMSRNNGGWGFDCPTQDLRDAFEPGDPRIVYTFTETGDIFNGNDKINNEQSPTGYHNRKVHIPLDEQDWHWGTDQPMNIRYLRYADVLLLYAEVLNENGQGEKALKFLNQVRDRARATNPMDPKRMHQVTVIEVDLPPVTTTNKEELRLKIWHERRVELALEYHRREDLIRQKRFGEVMRGYAAKWNTQKGANFTDNYHYLCPIPQEEIDKSNGVIIQNTGY